MISQQLNGNEACEWRCVAKVWSFDPITKKSIIFRSDSDDKCAPCGEFGDIRLHVVVCLIVGEKSDDGRFFFDESDRPVLEFSPCQTFGMNIGDFLYLQCCFARHIRDLFRDVPNAKFVWVVNSDSVPNTADNAITKYYPGDSYVDAVGVDGFNFGSPWQSFDAIFNKPLTLLTSYGKPIYILSVASAEGSGKAAWITDALTVQIPKYPSIVGWIWFNVNKEADWRVNSSPQALNAFRAALEKNDGEHGVCSTFSVFSK